MASTVEAYPLYNTSWTLYRASPLYHTVLGPGLFHGPTSLKAYSAQLRIWLRGDDSFAGGVGSPDDLLNTGALKHCAFTQLPTQHHSQEATRDTNAYHGYDTSGLLLSIAYEKAYYKAILLYPQGGSEVTETSDSTSLPLLLVRMPGPLRQTVFEFLAKTFDTHISPLTLQSPELVGILERYLATLWEPSALSMALIQPTIRDLVLTFTMAHPISPSLRTMEARLESSTVLKLMKRAQHTPGNAWPLLRNIGAHLQDRTGLNVNNAFYLHKEDNGGSMRLSRIACGAFVLSEDGRLKLVDPKTVVSGAGGGRAQQTAGVGDTQEEVSESFTRTAESVDFARKARMAEAIERADEDLVTTLIRKALPDI